MSERIFLDFQTTTPLDPEVLERMLPWMRRPANPHSIEHAFGREAEAAVERAREQVAATINCDPAGVIFTANATEAANIVLRSFTDDGVPLVGPNLAPTAQAALRVEAANPIPGLRER